LEQSGALSVPGATELGRPGHAPHAGAVSFGQESRAADQGRQQIETIVLKVSISDLPGLRFCRLDLLDWPCQRYKWRQVLKRNFLRFLSDESGATAIEYGLIAAGIALAIIAAVNGLGSNLNTVFTSVNTGLK
jgi:pilus assembly protein Flp/PilA